MVKIAPDSSSMYRSVHRAHSVFQYCMCGCQALYLYKRSLCLWMTLTSWSTYRTALSTQPGNTVATYGYTAVACLLHFHSQKKMHREETAWGTGLQACQGNTIYLQQYFAPQVTPEGWAYLNLVRCVNCSCPWTGHWFWDWRWVHRPTWLGVASSPALSQWFSGGQSLCREHSACNPVWMLNTQERLKRGWAIAWDTRPYQCHDLWLPFSSAG